VVTSTEPATARLNIVLLTLHVFSYHTCYKFVFSVTQTTASDCTFVTLLAARSDAIRRYRDNNDDLKDAEVNARLVAYCSDQVT